MIFSPDVLVDFGESLCNFQFHPQFLVLFCRTNTLDREKKQEGQGLMVHSSTYLYGRGKCAS